MEETYLEKSQKNNIGLVLVSYIAAYSYALILFPVVIYERNGYSNKTLGYPWLCTLLVFAGVVYITESLNKEKRPIAESFVWLACFAACTVSSAFTLSHVWDEGQIFLFVHVFCIYWIISRGGCLVSGESSRLLLLDGINGFFKYPLMHFFDRIKAIRDCIKEKSENNKSIKIKKEVWWSLGALVLCVLLFIAAGSLLSSADAAFGKAIDKFVDLFNINVDLDDFFFIRLFCSFMVGAYLYGLMHGSSTAKTEELSRQRGAFEAFLLKLRKISPAFWTVVIAVFSLMYLAFFVMQSSYLFGAFAGKLPDGFIVSQYAREGFFELCKVIAVNFSLLWLVTRMAKDGSENNKGFKISCLALLAESMLFAIIAFSKLAMYIDIFGFTPLRFQSIWLVCVLFVACICWIVSLLSGESTFKLWMYFGAVSLTVLCLV